MFNSISSRFILTRIVPFFSFYEYFEIHSFDVLNFIFYHVYDTLLDDFHFNVALPLKYNTVFAISQRWVLLIYLIQVSSVHYILIII